ncbi:MAG: hypothetical protein KGL92_08050 [Gammaproteobacteria bacterium]|nr:hypothetical protein [Gammaproteobacteria bacterium]
MISFLIIAAAMTAIAAAAVALPLLRDHRSRGIAALAAVILVVGAGGLYKLWSTWDWSTVQQAGAAPLSPQVAAMIAQLEQHLQDHPDDLSGWVMLGRSYVATGRLNDAMVAYEHALKLSDGKSFEATIGYGEALAVQSGGRITPQAAQLFEQAVTMAPANPKALLYGGFAAAVRGDNALARSRWEALIALNPPAPVVQMLNARIAELGPAPANTNAGAGAGAGAAVAASTTATAASVTVHIGISPELRARLRGGAPLFVFAKLPGASGPPLAVKRLTTAAIGTSIELSSADSMVPGMALTAGEHVLLTARVSFSGQPIAASGDLYGEVPYQVGHAGVAKLIIDHVAP